MLYFSSNWLKGGKGWRGNDIGNSEILDYERVAYCTGDRIFSANYNDIDNTENLHQESSAVQPKAEYFNDNAISNTEILDQASSTVQLVTANDNDIVNSEILHQESSKSKTVLQYIFR